MSYTSQKLSFKLTHTKTKLYPLCCTRQGRLGSLAKLRLPMFCAAIVQIEQNKYLINVVTGRQQNKTLKFSRPSKFFCFSRSNWIPDNYSPHIEACSNFSN